MTLALDGLLSRRRLLRPRLQLLLLPLLLLFFLGHVMPDRTTGRGAHYGMVASDMTRYGAHSGTFETTLRLCRS